MADIPLAKETIGLGVYAGQKVGAGIKRVLPSTPKMGNEPTEMFYQELNSAEAGPGQNNNRGDKMPIGKRTRIKNFFGRIVGRNGSPTSDYED